MTKIEMVSGGIKNEKFFAPSWNNSWDALQKFCLFCEERLGGREREGERDKEETFKPKTRTKMSNNVLSNWVWPRIYYGERYDFHVASIWAGQLTATSVLRYKYSVR